MIWLCTWSFCVLSFSGGFGFSFFPSASFRFDDDHDNCYDYYWVHILRNFHFYYYYHYYYHYHYYYYYSIILFGVRVDGRGIDPRPATVCVCACDSPSPALNFCLRHLIVWGTKLRSALTIDRAGNWRKRTRQHNSLNGGNWHKRKSRVQAVCSFSNHTELWGGGHNRKSTNSHKNLCVVLHDIRFWAVVVAGL